MIQKKKEITPHREKPTPLKPTHPEVNPDHWEEKPTEPNPQIPERETMPQEQPTRPGERSPEIDQNS